MEAAFVLFVLLQALTIGAFCYYIAGQKNRGQVAWFFLGFLFSFVALLALVAVPKIEKIEHRSAAFASSDLKSTVTTPRMSDERVCPFCAETIKAAAKICRFCQRDVQAGSIHMPAPSEQSVSTQNLNPDIDWNSKDEDFCLTSLKAAGFTVAFSTPSKWSITSPSKGSTSFAYSLRDLRRTAKREA